MEVKIYYEDTDCGGLVYYANYLKYFERARTHYLEDRGLSVSELMKAGRVFVVVHAEVDYRAPARYGETLEIDTIVSEMNPAAITFSHVVRERHRPSRKPRSMLASDRVTISPIVVRSRGTSRPLASSTRTVDRCASRPQDRNRCVFLPAMAS